MGLNKSERTIYKTPRTIYISPKRAASPKAGCECCFGGCKVCTCVKWGVAATPTGIAKSIEFVLGLISQLLLFNFGLKYSGDLGGLAFPTHLATTCSSVYVSGILLFCYVISDSALDTVRPSIFEVTFNLISCVLYISTSSSLTFQVHKNLFYYYNTIPGFNAYPALTAVYVIGYLLGITHGVDCIMAYKDMRSRRL